MIDQRHAHRIQCHFQRCRRFPVFPAWQCEAGRMVVRHHDRRGIPIQRRLDDFPRRDLRHIDRAAVNQQAVKHFALGIQTEQIHHFLLLPDEPWKQVLRTLICGIQNHCFSGTIHHVPPFHLHEKLYQIGYAFANTVYLQKLGTRRFQHTGKASKPAQQRMGDLIGIPPRNDRVQRHLQHLNVGQTVHSADSDLTAHPFAVSCVFAHKNASFRVA